jgi:hypothetical protein
MRVIALSILIFLGMFTTAAFASSVAIPTDDSTIQEMLKAIADAFQSGHKLYAGMVALAVAVVAIKKLAPKWKALDQKVHTDIGGAVLTLAGSFAGAMITSMAAGNYSPSWPMARAALYIAVGAAGGYVLIKKLIIEPILRPLSKKAPAYLQPIFALIFYIFDKPTPIEAAEAEGQKAVEEKPATGMGDVKDVE